MKQLSIQAAAKALQHGEVIAYPTESVFGLGADPKNSVAVQKLLALKGRDAAKGLILIAADLSDLAAFIIPLNSQQQELLHSIHQGYTHTWLVPISAACKDYLHGEFETIAIRLTRHPIAFRLCQAFGAIISTSANPHSLAPAQTIDALESYFKDEISLVTGKLGTLQTPTRIIDLKSQQIIRA